MIYKLKIYNISENEIKDKITDVYDVIDKIKIHLKGSDQRGKKNSCIFDPKGTNEKIKSELIKKNWIPNLKIPDAGFYLWLPVKDDLKATIDLWRDYSVRVMPGTFMAENVSGQNPCKGFLRIALVHKKEIVTEAMQRISNYFKNNHA